MRRRRSTLKRPHETRKNYAHCEPLTRRLAAIDPMDPRVLVGPDRLSLHPDRDPARGPAAGCVVVVVRVTDHRRDQRLVRACTRARQGSSGRRLRARALEQHSSGSMRRGGWDD
jgi:hypothetical protein